MNSMSDDISLPGPQMADFFCGLTEQKEHLFIKALIPFKLTEPPRTSSPPKGPNSKYPITLGIRSQQRNFGEAQACSLSQHSKASCMKSNTRWVWVYLLISLIWCTQILQPESLFTSHIPLPQELCYLCLSKLKLYVSFLRWKWE